jgi:lipopolysaccharide/colanic/teichoic acid biosynthesis glycosyltransferase
MKQAGVALLVKRAIDVGVAAAALVATAPALAAVAAAVRVSMGGPVLFSQDRPGRGGRIFRIYKLRTMTDARAPDGSLRSDAERLTALGRLLRATSLDELPQLVNVLRGEMSLVGPRPLLIAYLPLYSATQARRHEVLPGITGWSQVRVRNSAPWGEKLALDVWYVDNWSLGLDLRILAETLRKVVRRDGVSHDRDATMPVFRGNGKHDDAALDPSL